MLLRATRLMRSSRWIPGRPGVQSKADEEAHRNRCLTTAYEPGSTTKPFTMAVAGRDPRRPGGRLAIPSAGPAVV